jgi:hypothetical protein
MSWRFRIAQTLDARRARACLGEPTTVTRSEGIVTVAWPDAEEPSR